MKKFKIVSIIFLILLCSSCKSGSSSTTTNNETEKPRQYAFTAFDTQCSISFYGVESDEKAEDYYYSMKTLVDNFDEVFSKTNENSEIYAINHRTSDTVTVSAETATLFDIAKSFYEWSHKKFDISAGTLIDLWDVKNRKTLPKDFEIEEAKKHVGNLNYDINMLEGDDAGKATITFYGDKQTQYDLGGLVKGYCNDALRDMLNSNDDIDACIVDLGGNILVTGYVAGRKDGEFRVGIFKPFSKNETIDTIKVTNKNVITSGNYRRYFKVDGDDRVYHHIIDPITGYPSNRGLDSVTIVSDNGLLGDYLSTTCFLLGEDESKELIDFMRNNEKFGDKSIQATYVRNDGIVTKYPKDVNLK